MTNSGVLCIWVPDDVGSLMTRRRTQSSVMS